MAYNLVDRIARIRLILFVVCYVSNEFALESVRSRTCPNPSGCPPTFMTPIREGGEGHKRFYMNEWRLNTYAKRVTTNTRGMLGTHLTLDIDDGSGVLLPLYSPPKDAVSTRARVRTWSPLAVGEASGY